MARRVADLRAAFDVLVGAHPRDPISVPATFTELTDRETLRIAVVADPPGGSTHGEIAAAVRAAADALSDAGHDVVEAIPPGYEETIDLCARLLAQDLNVGRPLLDLVMGEDAKQFLDIADEAFDAPTLETAVELQILRYAAMRVWAAFFLEHPVVISPTWAQPAFEHGTDLELGDSLFRDTLRPVLPANFLKNPSLS